LTADLALPVADVELVLDARLMARRADDIASDPALVLIDDHHTLSMDEWLASMMRGEPIELMISAAELVTEGRAEQE
jgi:hypothetical protein